MPQLSIVIPCVRDAVAFEATLASVLQNRPDDCEVLVIQPRAYSDPYQLADEVVFVQAPSDATSVDLINLGFQRAAGAIVHLLSCEVAVSDGWTDPVIGLFADPQLGSVSPLVIAPGDGAVVARGVRYAVGGGRRVCSATRRRRRTRGWRVAGPTLAAGFYRREAVLEAGGFCRDVGELLADVDLALALQGRGWRTAHEQDSIVMIEQPMAKAGLSWRQGRQSELLFWRHSAGPGRWRALLCHAGTLLGELVGNLHRPALALQLLGRAHGACLHVCRRRRGVQAVVSAAEGADRAIVPMGRGGEPEQRSSAHDRIAA